MSTIEYPTSLSNKANVKCYGALINNEEVYVYAQSMGEALRKISDLRLEDTDVITISINE